MKITISNQIQPGTDSFVASHPLAAEGHRPAWLDVLSRGLGHRVMSITAQRDGQVVGYLPLAISRGMCFGSHAVSLPFLSQAGPLADQPETRHALIDQAIQAARATGAQRIEIRETDTQYEHHAMHASRSDKIGMLRSMPGSADDLWASFNPKVRNQIRKAERNGVTIRRGGSELINPFYRLFTTNMRDLGTPVYARRFFEAMLHHLESDAELFVAEHEGQIAAASILVHRPGASFVPVASSLRTFNHTCANMLIYWHMMQRAIERGSGSFDFGRSTIDSGPHRFKKQWGAQPQTLNWRHAQLSGNADPVSREDPKYSRAVRLWQRLPIWATRIIGPPIARRIPA